MNRLTTGPVRERAAPVARPKRQAKLRLKNDLNSELFGNAQNSSPIPSTPKARTRAQPRR